MAEGKKSFVLYCDQKETWEALTDEQAGKLIKHIFAYVNDENPTIDEPILNIAFLPIKQSLKRDLIKYEHIKERNSLNGSKGGRPKKETQKKPKKPTGLIGNPKKPKKADSDSDSDSVSGSEKDKKETYRAFAHLCVSISENAKLIEEGYAQSQINGVYDSIENYKKNTAYKSLYLTAKKWLKKEYPNTKPLKVEAVEDINLSNYDISNDEMFGYKKEVLKQMCLDGKFDFNNSYKLKNNIPIC
jgi:hypothetical protein